jgi:hypothetical protein
VVAPVAQLALARPEVLELGGLLDGLPQREQLALNGEQVGLVGGVAQDRAVTEVHQLQQLRDLPRRTPQDVGVELHLEQRLALERLPRRFPGLVIDDSHVTGGRDVEPVDDAAQPQSAGEDDLDVLLPLRDEHPARVLEAEVALQELLGTGQPGRQVRLVREHLADGWLGREQRLPLRPEQVPRGVRSALLRRQLEQALQHRVHDRAARGRRGGRLGQPVDRAEPEQQRAGHEVTSARRREGSHHRKRKVDCHRTDRTTGVRQIRESAPGCGELVSASSRPCC